MRLSLRLDPGAPGRLVLGTGRVAALNIACTWHGDHPDTSAARSRLLSEVLTGAEVHP